MRLLEESLVLTCPNPKCRRQFKESIILTINSVEPPKQYEACPFCFASLETESQIEQVNIAEQEIQQTVAQEPILGDENLEFEELEETDELTDDDQEKARDSGTSFFKKVKSLIPGSSGTKKEKTQKPGKPKIKQEPLDVKENQPEDNLKFKPSIKNKDKNHIRSKGEQDENSGCPQAFGYLANRPKDEPIPQVCFVCPKMVDCMLSAREN